ncbi:unnamed protein product [Alopecurus aequalis]
METMLAQVRAPDKATLYSLYFPDHGHVKAAAVAGCVCLDELTCTECEPILGVSFNAIVLAARKKQRRHPPVPVTRVDPGPEQGIRRGPDQVEPGLNGRVEGFEASISGMAAPLVPFSHPPLDGVESSNAEISGTAERLVPGSNGVVEGFEAAISRMAAAVGERAKEVFRKMEEARAWQYGPGRNKYAAYAACLSIACRNEGTARSLRELALATADGGGGAAVASRRWEIARLVAHIRRRLGEEAGQAAGIGMASVSSFTRRFVTLVGLEESEWTVALEAARRLDDGVLDVRHNVDSLAAAVVCLTLERAGAKRPVLKDVEAATGISDTTIYNVCKKLRDHGDLLFR